MAPVNLTKLVAEKLKRGEDRKHDLAVHGASLPARVAQALAFAPLEAPLSALLAQADNARDQNDRRLAAADRAYLAELGDDAALRAEKSEAEAALYSTVTGVRAIVGAAHGPLQVRSVGFVGDTPSDIAQLIRLAPVLAEGLRGLPPTPRGSRVAVDIDGLCADLEQATARAQAAQDASRADAKENEAAIRNRNDAITVAHRGQVFLGELLRLCALTLGDADLQHRLRDLPLSSPTANEPEPEATPAVG